MLAELFRLPWPCTPSLHPLPVVFRDGRCVRLLRTLRGHPECQSLVNLGNWFFKFQIPNSKFGQIKLFAPKSRNPRVVLFWRESNRNEPRSTAIPATTTAASEAKRHLAAGTREGGVGGVKRPRRRGARETRVHEASLASVRTKKKKINKELTGILRRLRCVPDPDERGGRGRSGGVKQRWLRNHGASAAELDVAVSGRHAADGGLHGEKPKEAEQTFTQEEKPREGERGAKRQAEQNGGG